MTERPIHLSPWEVPAILAGRKTQLRRIVKPQPAPDGSWDWSWPLRGHGVPQGTTVAWRNDSAPTISMLRHCPFGVPGDRLWVREAWQYAPKKYCRCPEASIGPPCDDWCKGAGCRSDRSGVVYAADDWTAARWRPSVQMPRCASRITLEVQDVRVQRVQEISEEDALAEGCSPAPITAEDVQGCDGVFDQLVGATFTSKFEFMRLWDSIHGPGAWERNDWIWAVTFRRLEAA